MNRATMLNRFRDIPIGRKLVIITMATTTTALLLAGLGVVLADSILFRGYLRRDLNTLASIISDNSTAALAFNDPTAASQTLGALRARSHVDAACIYRLDGSILARYSRQPGFDCPPPASASMSDFRGGNVTLARPILLGGRSLGTLTLLYDLDEIEDRVRLYGTTVGGVLLVASLFAFLLSSRLRSVIATPVASLVSATRSVSETGDYSIRAQKLSGDELGVLVDRFNEMLTGIQARNDERNQALTEREAALREVEKERERFHFMAESMPQKIFAAGPTGESIYLNRQWMEFTGLALEQIKEWGWVQFIHPEDLEEGLRVWKNCIATGEPLQFTSRFRRADGVYRWHLNRARALRNAGGEITLWIGSSTEIHEQKEREDELRRANEDLEQFAFSASHDLQEPIRNVAVYSELVARRYHHLLDAEGQLYLEFLREGGRRLATLVSDLLAYTRASTAELSETSTDASEALRGAIASLSEAVRETHAIIMSDPLPEVHMGMAHLQQVFQNLIGNAIKYRSDSAPQIYISSASRGAFWCFSVQDNGIGIDPQYKEKIFGVFKRLHHDHKYSGNGIGLAICQRVVERYGGRIWIESSPGKGSIFSFTVPQHAESGEDSTLQSAAG